MNLENPFQELQPNTEFVFKLKQSTCPFPVCSKNGDMRLRRNAQTTLCQDEIENCLNSIDMIRAEKIADATVEPQIDVKIGKCAKILRSWPDDEVGVAGELYHRVQKIKKCSRIDMICGEEIADAAVMPQIDVKIGKWAEIIRS
ncbi:hypothetical protein RHMOL_Rhmol04G0023500 [Rhododendron molle]|uniref:Uncharacterized protein n=1 Tax=Rhododendron molle TaxID=49168 RepID=A0ACC0NXH7_RHOML|nr:hypothetical protein RHMOL_Rhmol04G0023500 [Rhododendron molle]